MPLFRQCLSFLAKTESNGILNIRTTLMQR